MVPLDGSKNSIRGLKFALGIAKQSDSSVVGLNVNVYSMFAKTLSVKQKIKKIMKQAELMSQKEKVPFRGVIEVDENIGRTIVTFAQSNKIDLIVIGSRGPNSHLEIFLGSVANHVVNKSKIPVTVVK